MLGMPTLTLSLIEIIVLMLGAVVLGITIHFFITSRRSLKISTNESGKVNKNMEEWKLKYFNDIELRDKELATLRQRLGDSEENSNINSIEAEELRNMNKKLRTEIENLRKVPVASPEPKHDYNYIEQLREAQSSLLEHNEKINRLLGQIDIVKETEQKQQEILKNNEQLSEQIAELRSLLSQKEKEVNNIKQKEHLTKEMTSILDSAYSEFNVLQSKIQKLETQVSSTKMVNMDYEDMKEAHYKMARDFEESRLKLNHVLTENQQLQSQLTETEDKLREANFQRQQLQKRITYLEELNNDLQAVSDANKKLEGQLKRIGELESRLNVISEERDELAKRQMNE
jgi:DNA repair exonuclease SbcCD ATPase subunit